MSRLAAALRHCLREGLLGLWRNRGASLLAVTVIGAALFVFGVFLLAAANLGRAVGGWEEDLMVTVFLQEGVATTQVEALRAEVARCPLAASVVHVSREEARRRFLDSYPGLAEAEGRLKANPFPESLEVRLRPTGERIDPRELGRWAEVWSSREGVAEVQMDTEWVERLGAAATAARLAGLLFGAAIGLAALFTASAVIRLALYSRQEEVEILRIVGATGFHIRGPYLVEGTLLGLLGAALSLLLLLALWLGALRRLPEASSVLFGWLVAGFLPLAWIALLLAAGASLGLLGSILALARRPGPPRG